MLHDLSKVEKLKINNSKTLNGTQLSESIPEGVFFLSFFLGFGGFFFGVEGGASGDIHKFHI